jgi:YihY family inner membrane protein
MHNKLYSILRGTLRLYLDKQVPRAAAALSYYLTMSLFPLLICLYALLGSSYGRMLQLLELLDQFLSPEATRYVKNFLLYVADSHSPAMLVTGVTLLFTSASAAMRVMRQEMREIRGDTGKREGLRGFLGSLFFSLVFLTALYFGILVMLTGQTFLEIIEQAVPLIPISRAWNLLRFPVLGGLVFLALWGMYAVSSGQEKRRGGKAPGALVGMGGIVLMSWIFSEFIAVSYRYPLVYGSLASIILLMLWLFLCSQMIFLGAAVNASLDQQKTKE